MISPPLLRIATRNSPLALWQANHVKDQLQRIYPQAHVSLLGITTQGDKLLAGALNAVGGKGLFVKELEQALLSGEADLAVHSMKDVTVEFPPGLGLVAIGERADPRDAFISNQVNDLTELPLGSRVGTASLRRTALLKAARPDLHIDILRGNVASRLDKLDRGEFAAIILAAAGLERLKLAHRIRSYFSPEQFLPAVGQGAVGIECCTANITLCQQLAPLNHAPTEQCITAERAMNRALGGGCHVPVAGYALLDHNELWLRGTVATLDGNTVLTAQTRGNPKDADQLGQDVANALIAQGAHDLLNEIRRGNT